MKTTFEYTPSREQLMEELKRALKDKDRLQKALTDTANELKREREGRVYREEGRTLQDKVAVKVAIARIKSSVGEVKSIDMGTLLCSILPDERSTLIVLCKTLRGHIDNLISSLESQHGRRAADQPHHLKVVKGD